MNKMLVKVLACNEETLLSRVTGLVNRLGCSVSDFSMAELPQEKSSYISFILAGLKKEQELVVKQLRRLVDIKEVNTLKLEGSSYKESLFLQVKFKEENLKELKKIISVFGGKITEESDQILELEFTASSLKADIFLEVLAGFGIEGLTRRALIPLDESWSPENN